MKGMMDEKGQLAVEFALVAPILVLIGLVIFSLARFIYLANKFDSVCRQVIVVEGVAPVGSEGESDMNERIRFLIAERFDEESKVDIEVTSRPYSSGGLGNILHIPQIRPLKEYTCTMTYTPLFSDLRLGYASVRSPLEMTKEVKVIVDPYAAGILV